MHLLGSAKIFRNICFCLSWEDCCLTLWCTFGLLVGVHYKCHSYLQLQLQSHQWPSPSSITYRCVAHFFYQPIVLLNSMIGTIMFSFCPSVSLVWLPHECDVNKTTFLQLMSPQRHHTDATTMSAEHFYTADVRYTVLSALLAIYMLLLWKSCITSRQLLCACVVVSNSMFFCADLDLPQMSNYGQDQNSSSCATPNQG